MINGKKYWVDVPDCAPSQAPMEILQRIKRRASTITKENQKILDKCDLQWKKQNACYFNWLEENHIINFKAVRNISCILFKFVDADDAMAFKLRWL